MNATRVGNLALQIKSLKSAKFEMQNWAFVSFTTDFTSMIRNKVISIGEDASGIETKQFAKEMNEAIQPVIQKWIKHIEEKMKKEIQRIS